MATVLLFAHESAWAEVADKLTDLSTHWLITALLITAVFAGLRVQGMYWHFVVLAGLWQILSLWELHLGPIAQLIPLEAEGLHHQWHLWASALVTGAVFALTARVRRRSNTA